MKSRTAKPKAEASRKYLGELLDVATSCGFKVWNLSRPLRCMKWVICAAAFAAVVWLFYQYWEFHIIPAKIEAGLTYRNLGIAVLTIVFFAVLAAVFNALAGAKLGKRITRIVRWRDTFKYILIGVGMSTIGFLIARLHLHVFDKIYLYLGKLERLPKK